MPVYVMPRCVSAIVLMRNNLAVRLAQELDLLNKNAEQVSSQIMDGVENPKVKHFLQQQDVLRNLFQHGRSNFKLHLYQMAQFESLDEVFAEFKKLTDQWADFIRIELSTDGERVEFTFTAVI